MKAEVSELVRTMNMNIKDYKAARSFQNAKGKQASACKEE